MMGGQQALPLRKSPSHVAGWRTRRRVRMAPRTICLFEGARWTVYLMARSTEQDWRLLGLSLPSRLWFYSSGNYGRHLYIFLPFARRLCITRFARPINRKGPELACEGAASAIEAATAGETRSGSTEGESAVGEAEAPMPNPLIPLRREMGMPEWRRG